MQHLARSISTAAGVNFITRRGKKSRTTAFQFPWKGKLMQGSEAVSKLLTKDSSSDSVPEIGLVIPAHRVT